jgi:DNA-binding Lrp family transcriptional regulator
MIDEEKNEAYMLLVVEHGADEEVLQNLTKIEGIEEASLVLGEYDIHCKLRVDNMKKIREILAKVRKLKILTSETLIAYKKAPRVKRVTNRHIRNLGHKRARH